MTDATDESVDSLVEALEEYFLRNPHAADTLEGITRWWLSRHLYLESRPRVERAIKRLLEKGFLIERRQIGGNIIYSKRKQP